jgi:GT2 family glycosyltransferase
MRREPFVTFVIPVRDAHTDLARCLGSIQRASDGYPCEVVVVDNGSTDGSAELARREGATVMVRPGLRVGALRNAGSRLARGRILAFVDADHELDDGWVGACIKVLENPLIGAAGLACHAPVPATWVQRMYDLLRARPEHPSTVRWLGAGNMAVVRSVFESVGGFDERLEACEDVALCEAIRAAGFGIVAEPRMRSIHYGDPATLRALFVGEMWRGRDNLRVSVKGTWRSKLGALVSLASLVAVALFVAGVAAIPWTGWRPAVLSATAVVLLALSRTVAIIRRGRLRAPLHWTQSLAVALTFEVARALALLGTTTHAMRRGVGTA